MVKRVLVENQRLFVRDRSIEHRLRLQPSLHVGDDGRLVVEVVAAVGGESETGQFKCVADVFALSDGEFVDCWE